MWNSYLNIGILTMFTAATVYAVVYDKKIYFATERPTVTYYNPKYLKYVDVSSRRYNRRDPVYYYHFHAYSIYAVGNNYTFSFYFYQFLTNTYKRSFVEIHAKACVLVHKEPIFGAVIEKALQEFKPGLSCPYPAGEYNLHNCTVNTAPLANFPFPKGRIYLNTTITATKEVVGNGYIDFEIREMKVKKN